MWMLLFALKASAPLKGSGCPAPLPLGAALTCFSPGTRWALELGW